ncbi:hypothetical protein, partial [Sporisorium scitamineum]
PRDRRTSASRPPPLHRPHHPHFLTLRAASAHTTLRRTHAVRLGLAGRIQRASRHTLHLGFLSFRTFPQPPPQTPP